MTPSPKPRPSRATAATTTIAPATTVAEIPLDSGGVPPADYAGFRLQERRAAPSRRRRGSSPSIRHRRTWASIRPADPLPSSRRHAATSRSSSTLRSRRQTVNSFVFLAESGYFDGTASHRIVPGFVIQAGDPTATGIEAGRATSFPTSTLRRTSSTSGRARHGERRRQHHGIAVLHHARRRRPARRSFSVFGRVTSGLDVLDTIAAHPARRRPVRRAEHSPRSAVPR